MRKEVLDYIRSKFDLSQCRLEDAPLYPGGVWLVDSKGVDIIFFKDINTQKIMYIRPGDRKPHIAPW